MILRDAKRSILAVGVFLVPMILVKGAALLIGQGGLQRATAKGPHPPDDPTAVLKPYVAVWPAEQLAAAKHSAWLRGQPFGSSPLLHQVIARVGFTPDEHATGTQPVPPPNVVLQAIMRTPGGNIALINRKRYHEGDPLDDKGWVVKTIDPESRSVIIEHPLSGEATLTVPLPLSR